MPRMITLNGSTNSVAYTLSGTEMLRVESVSADVDTTGAAADSFGDVIYRDASAFLIARSRSSASLFQGSAWIMTWAPQLPDTFVLGNQGLVPVATTGLADTLVPPGGTITVTASDAGAKITQARLWVDNVSDMTGDNDAEALTLGPWAFVPGPGA